MCKFTKLTKFVFSATSLDGPCLLTAPAEKNWGNRSRSFLPRLNLAKSAKTAPKNIIMKPKRSDGICA